MSVLETVAVVAALSFAPVVLIVMLVLAFRWRREAGSESWDWSRDDWEACVRSHEQALARRKSFRLVRGDGEGGSPIT